MELTSKLNILHIEDNPADARLVEIYLKDSSSRHQLFKAKTLSQGIDLFIEKKINICLLDLHLPDSKGFKSVTTFLEKTGPCPLVVITSMNNEVIGRQAIKAGAQDFLVKGEFDAKLLNRMIRHSYERFQIQEKLTEQSLLLKTKEQSYREAQFIGKFGNWELDIVSNTFTWNDQILRILEIKNQAPEQSFQSLMDLVHFDDKEHVQTFFDQALKDGKMNQTDFRVLLPGHKVKHLAIQARIKYDELTQRTLLVGVLQDISDRKLKEQLTIEKNISIKQESDKIDLLEGFAFHIRTPMSSITNMLYLMLKNQNNGQNPELLNGLKTSYDDLASMIHNLLNSVVLQKNELKPQQMDFQLHDLLKSTTKLANLNQKNADVEIKLDLHENLPTDVSGDVVKLNQLLFNLLQWGTNNIKEPSIMQLHAQSQKSIANGDSLSVQITYPSLQFDKALLSNVIQPESILAKQKHGSIPDLPILLGAKLVKIMGGKIDLSNKVQKGGIVQFDIPIKVNSKEVLLSFEQVKNPVNILLVEDHFLNQIATKKLLSSWSPLINIDIAENGLVAVDKVRMYEYDIILMDLQMPVMNGFEAAMKIRLNNSTPIIALSASSSKSESDKAIAAGMNDYMAKPFEPEALYQKITDQINRDLAQAI